MKALGITNVRIAEFMWSIIEPTEGTYNWTIIDNILNLFKKYDLKAIIGTPTATPPKWIIDKYGGDGNSSEILPFGVNGQARKFGSRRHYRFSSERYIAEMKKIVTAMVDRYGKSEVVAGWQLDNEYGCHDTVRSYDTMDSLPKFRNYLAKKFNNNVSSLNKAWGNSFWSMDYNAFKSIDLPNMCVTEANPAHWLEFYRYSSEEASNFNKLAFDTVRSSTLPSHFITSNFMGFFFDFDHYDLAQNLDIASWDSYPLGITDTSGFMISDAEAIKYARTGHPDVAAFNHDLYSAVSGRGLTRKPFFIMEQQPGPVNWANHNPSPAPGQIRLWTWEAIAHGAAMVSYFRWRQAQFAQEQMHAGLMRPDNVPDVAYFESKQVKGELETLAELLEKQSLPSKAPVALLFDYQSQWVSQIQPQGQEYNYVAMTFRFYTEVRRLGLDVDILRPGADLTGYKIVIVPSLPIVTSAALASFQSYIKSDPKAQLLFGPRSGSKTENTFQIPNELPPGLLQTGGLLPGLKIIRVETFGPGAPSNGFVKFQGQQDMGTPYSTWKEWLEINAADYTVRANFTYGSTVERPAMVTYKNQVHYLAVFPTNALAEQAVEILTSGSLDAMVVKVPCEGVRVRKARENLTFIFNSESEACDVSTLVPSNAKIVLGSTDKRVGPSDVLAFTLV